MSVLFGSLNTTIAGTIAANSPKHTKIVEPFGDGGTYALYLKKKKPKEHILNIEDEVLFNAFIFIQNISSSEKSALKKKDWVSSKETFDAVLKINADQGVDFFYSWFYKRHFGSRVKEEGEIPEYDLSKIGVDISNKLFDIPLMVVGLKGVNIINEDPISVMNSANGFLILLPKKPEHIESTESKLNSFTDDFYYSAKVADFSITIEAAELYTDLNVASQIIATIMMGNFSTITNYENKLKTIDLDLINENI